MAEPAARSPVVLTLTPSPSASRVVARLFTGSGPGEYLLFSTFSFQLPSELSAAMASVARASLKKRCIRVPPCGRWNHGDETANDSGSVSNGGMGQGPFENGVN